MIIITDSKIKEVTVDFAPMKFFSEGFFGRNVRRSFEYFGRCLYVVLRSFTITYNLVLKFGNNL